MAQQKSTGTAQGKRKRGRPRKPKAEATKQPAKDESQATKQPAIEGTEAAKGQSQATTKPSQAKPIQANPSQENSPLNPTLGKMSGTSMDPKPDKATPIIGDSGSTISQVGPADPDEDDTVTHFEPIFGKQPGGAQEGQQSDHPTAGAMDAAPESGTPEPPAPPAPEKETEPDPEVDPILTYAEAARRIGKTRETVRRWAKDGLLKTVKHPSGVSGIRQSHFDKLYGTAQALHKGEN